MKSKDWLFPVIEEVFSANGQSRFNNSVLPYRWMYGWTDGQTDWRMGGLVGEWTDGMVRLQDERMGISVGKDNVSAFFNPSLIWHLAKKKLT